MAENPHKAGREAHAIANERLKLTANALDRTSTACLAVGIFTPVIGLKSPEQPLEILLTFAVWLVAAIMLHIGGQWTLGGIR